MLKLMIADDERIIRETLSTIVNWDSMGICFLGTCKDGIEAYDMILDEDPDIVITDIRMPGLTGLDLIKAISQTPLQTRFIVLSGHGEFEYAQEAMKYGVKHYLLKPCKENQLIETLKAICDECRQAQGVQALPQLPSDALSSQVMEHVNAHLSEPCLTLKWIAETKLYMNVDYVSRQFHKMTGKKFSQYLTEQRVQKAKELLIKEPEEKIQIIAEQVGCENAQYFIQIFKKITNTTPKKWVKQLRE